MGQRVTQLMMKQTVNSLAMLQSALERAQKVASAWLSPLELAACLHLASFDIHLNLHSFHCEPDHCWCSALTGPSLHEMATIGIALFTLLLALLDWHVPPVTCRILTAMCMHAVRMDSACTFMALLLPTFGKRAQDRRNSPRKRATTTSPATEQTGDAAMTPASESLALSQPTELSQSSASTDPMHLPVLPIVVETREPTGHAATEHTASEMEASMPMDDIITELSLHQTDDAQTVTSAARIILEGKQDEIRKLCKPWGVLRKKKNEVGKYANRPNATLKNELEVVLTKRTMELKRESNEVKHDVKEVDSTGGAAIEHAGTEFVLEESLTDALHRIRDIGGGLQILARVVDHACHSESCISHRIATMCREASWKTSVDLCSDQPVDACGYIAADAVCRLRETALAHANSWHHLQLPDYSQLQCIEAGNKALHKRSDNRILETDEVNRLVRHYSHLDQRHQAAEEWWGGAIAIDHFLTGLPNSIQELSTIASDKQHRWRAWIVNTQTSRQQGSHWFTVIIGTQTQLLQSTAAHKTSDTSASQLAMDPIASSSDAGTATSPSRKLPDRTAMPAIARASSPMEPASSTDSSKIFRIFSRHQIPP
jgi:hypothetical protein